MNEPKFQAHFHVEISGSKTVFLLSEKGHFVLKGQLYCLLAPLLDGSHTVENIIEQLQGKATAEEVKYAIALLEQKGYLTQTNNSLTPEATAFWNLLGIGASVVTEKLQNTQVSVLSLGNVSTTPLITHLQSLAIPVGDSGNFTLVLTDDYLQTGLEKFNQEMLQDKRSWLLVKPVGAVLWIGPIFSPGSTGCWECLAHRLRENREVESFLQEQQGILSPFPISRSALPSTLQTAWSLVATEVAKWLVTPERHSLLGTVLTFDLMRLDLQRHTLIKRPQCQCCGKLAPSQQQPIELRDSHQRFTLDGGHRIDSPEQVFERYQHHISPITGIIRSLVQPFPNNDLIHAYAVDHSLPREGNEIDHLRQAVRPKSFGKGKTAIQAKVSGLGEAIERYSASFAGDEPRLHSSYVDLGDEAIHPYTCLHYSERQYQKRDRWNAQHHFIQWIPDPFDESEKIEWTAVWSLTQQTFKYVPTAYCYLNYPNPTDRCFCYADTNGTAAGTCLEEAILQGFMELVERDAVALWWYNRLNRPRVNLASFKDPYFQSLEILYQSLGREFWVLDLTSDLTIPTFAAISRRTNRQPEDILFGFGTHFDARLALLRAVTEMNQMVFLANGGHPTAPAQFTRSDIKTWCETATVENQLYLLPNPSLPAKVYTDYPAYQRTNLKADVLACVQLAAREGLETLVLDLTRPDLGMNVVRVIVPGLRHFWAQFAPGRLDRVPVKLGWLQEPIVEEQLNPIPMFL